MAERATWQNVEGRSSVGYAFLVNPLEKTSNFQQTDSVRSIRQINCRQLKGNSSPLNSVSAFLSISCMKIRPPSRNGATRAFEQCGN
jgi:hypothetical protein